jgi:hypothetical protein
VHALVADEELELAGEHVEQLVTGVVDVAGRAEPGRRGGFDHGDGAGGLLAGHPHHQALGPGDRSPYDQTRSIEWG